MLKKVYSQKNILCFLMMSFGLITSCKKNNSADESPSQTTESNTLQTPTTNRAELTKDSIFLYAKQTYFWNIGMPSYDDFNPRKYSSNEQVLAALKALPSTGGKDKYSFIDDGTVAGELGGVSGDYGFSVNYDGANILRVKYVYATSPAAVAGLKRGDIITKVNGRTTLRTSQSDIDNINDGVFGSNASVSLTITKADQTVQNLVINRGAYNINPILFSNTYTVGAKKIGYVVFNSFTTNSVPLLDAAFSKFATDGITELVVDLRYNGGGSVATSEAFTNLIAPSTQNGKIMYTTYWTKTMQDKKATILQNQKFYQTTSDGVKRLYSMFDYDYQPIAAAGNQEFFKKRGSLNGISRVYFLVTSGTASASELLINNLKPVMDVKLIGRKTYGKPVGFFSLRIDKNDLYIPQFQTKNQADFGDYFDGMTVDKDIADDLTRDFGDASESLLAQALNYSATGSFTSFIKEKTLSSTSGASRALIDHTNEQLDHEFKGMVETRKMKLK
ncbi:PDZ domain-containing protein [Pedobacter psychrotolerans]|uniref:PDZ domain-containing protein n=2 Tax=Pedobacter psychrotolerans TaxID=1843235 RepID=A0A4R2HGK1_9SPHI|nr:S41 family peptidase [Pedobacter psychrotolerans]TCO25480.1 PDZ domain-containing protein [Pedobacter psychrotolerans]